MTEVIVNQDRCAWLRVPGDCPVVADDLLDDVRMAGGVGHGSSVKSLILLQCRAFTWAPSRERER